MSNIHGNTSNQLVMVSSGQILFSNLEGSLWSPNDFPKLPYSFFQIGAKEQSFVDNTMLHSVQFINRISYEPFEPSTIYSRLSKTLHVDKSGTITYETEKVGFVSSYLNAFSTTISSFQYSSTIGGPAIQDVTTHTPDTITNALAKLDAWIANAFLYQPPAVTIAQLESTSMYAGVRWNNFQCYNIMDKFVPFVSGIVFVIGKPTSSYDKHYCVIEFNDTTYFPYKANRNGITKYITPLVRLRIFTKNFLRKADKLYTKENMKKRNVKLISEFGYCTFPSKGNVFAVENTDGQTTYTTLSLYLPNLPNAYPNGTNIPISILYVNTTEGKASPVNVNVQVSPIGGPSAISDCDVLASSESFVRCAITQPSYSDTNSSPPLTTPFFSSYMIQYSPSAYNLANEQAGVGYRYGVSDPNALSPYFSTPVTYSQSFHYVSSVQMATLNQSTFVPGMKWALTLTANNSAEIAGSAYPGPLVSTMFPHVSTPNLHSMTIRNMSDEWTGYQYTSSIHFAAYNTPTGASPFLWEGWYVGSNVPNDVVFLSTPTDISFQLSSVVQWNDSTYPGDRSTIRVKTRFCDTNNTLQIANTLCVSTFQNDFPIATNVSTYNSKQNMLNAYITDAFSDPAYQHYFYNVLISGTQRISTISTAIQTLQISLENRTLLGGTGAYSTILKTCDSSSDSDSDQNVVIETFEPIVPVILSSQTYVFTTDVVHPTRTSSLEYNNVCTDVVQISGLYTPSPSSRFYFDMYAQNFANYYIGSNFATAQLVTNAHIDETCDHLVPAGPMYQAVSTIHIYNGTTEIQTLPFPQDTILKFRSLSVGIFSNVYQDIGDIQPFFIHASVTPANPISHTRNKRIPLTSNIFIDTVSYPVLSTFTNTAGTHGMRVLSMVPRIGVFSDGYTSDDTTHVISVPTDIHDSVDYESGASGRGLDVHIRPYFQLSCDYTVHVSDTIRYDHTYTLSNAIPCPVPAYYYNRELLYTNGRYCHAAGHNFSVFKGDRIGKPDAVYPDFTNDLRADVNHGFRYATFAFESPIYPSPTTFQYIHIRVIGPHKVDRIQRRREGNHFFPIAPVPAKWMFTNLIKLHVKIFGTYMAQTLEQFESGWVNGFKESCLFTFKDTDFDAGGCVSVNVLDNHDVEYKVQINRRQYKNIFALVRLGISRDGARLHCEQGEISFQAIQVSYSDS